jgi:TonB-dependent starch-binding outer membrane protein SusC
MPVLAVYVNLSDGLRNTIKTDYWTPTNPSNEFPVAGLTVRARTSSAPLGESTLGYYDASFIKMRSINIGYTISPKLLTKLKLQSIRAYISIQNPFVIYSPYK